jgi:protein ImuA
VARIGRRPLPPGRGTAIPFGVPGIDAALPGGGISRGALHEAAGSGLDAGHGAAAALLTASVLARTTGPVLWVSAFFDLFAPALAAVGLGPDRVLHVEAGRDVWHSPRQATR